jgi:hypothetical protein
MTDSNHHQPEAVMNEELKLNRSGALVQQPSEHWVSDVSQQDTEFSIERHLHDIEVIIADERVIVDAEADSTTSNAKIKSCINTVFGESISISDNNYDRFSEMGELKNTRKKIRKHGQKSIKPDAAFSTSTEVHHARRLSAWKLDQDQLPPNSLNGSILSLKAKTVDEKDTK